MMIDKQVFQRTFAALCSRFNRTPDKDLAAVYYDYLASMLSGEEFRRAARAVIVNAEYFPRPVDFVLAVDGAWWPRVVEAVAVFSPKPSTREVDGETQEYSPHQEIYETFPMRVRRAVSLMGGLYDIKQSKIGQGRLQKDFTEALEAVQQSMSQEALELPPVERRIRLESGRGGQLELAGEVGHRLLKSGGHE